jgi:hypothetical protein
MIFLGAQVFLQNIHSFRTCQFDGRFGGGKTLIAVAIARYMQQTYGYSIYSNIDITLDGVVQSLPVCDCKKCLRSYRKMRDAHAQYVPQNHTCIVYDEAWLSFGQGAPSKQMQAYLAYIRKFDLIMLMPSVAPLAKTAAQLYCERTFNAGVFGIPLWIYQWGVKGKSVKDSGGKFALWRPSQMFGTYDTFAQPDILPGLYHDDKALNTALISRILEDNEVIV